MRRGIRLARRQHTAYAIDVFFLLVILFVVAVSLPVDLLAQPEGKPEIAPQILHHTLTYKVNEVQAEIAVNDVPILYGEYREPIGHSELINMWVKPGKNVVTVRLLPLKGPGKEGEFFEFTVTSGRSPQTAINGPKLAQFKWRIEESKEKLPLEKIFKFTPLRPPPSELWTKAEVLKLDEETEERAGEFVRRLSEALVKRNVEDLTKLLEFRLQEKDRWLHGGTQEFSDTRKDVEELLDAGEFQPVDMESLEMHLVAGGQLIWVTGKDYSRVLKVKGGASEAETDIYLARIEGDWTLAR
jgi:hypothetical protein